MIRLAPAAFLVIPTMSSAQDAQEVCRHAAMMVGYLSTSISDAATTVGSAQLAAALATDARTEDDIKFHRLMMDDLASRIENDLSPASSRVGKDVERLKELCLPNQPRPSE